MYDPSKEGTAHINAYSKSNTKLGRMLSNFSRYPFVCADGRFTSIEGYWYWLGTDHYDREKLRNLHGFKAKALGRELKAEDYPKIKDFREKIKKACWQKLLQNPEIKEELRNSTLPIVHYYSYGSPPKIVVPKEGKWIWEWYEKAREYLKKNPEF